MAELWHEYTGLGFVFAMWVIRAGASRAAEIDFAGARDEGTALVEDIVAAYKPLLQLPEEELRSYLQQNITFTVNEQMRAGLDLYFKLARKHELIPGLKPLK